MRKLKHIILATSAVAAMGVTLPAFAYGVGDFFAPLPKNFQTALSGLSVGIGQLHQNYTEIAPAGSTAPNPLDKENGSIKDFSFGMNGIGSHLGMGLGLNYGKGNTTYTGYLQSINSSGGVSYTPATNTTKSTIFNFNIALKGGFSPIHQLAIVPNVFYGIHYWNRDNSGSQYGYDEKYFNEVVGYGLTIAGSPIHSVVLQLKYKDGHTMGGKMTSGISSQTANLGGKPWHQVGFEVDYTPFSHLTVYASYTKTHFDYGQSQVIYSNGGYPMEEPNSTTKQNLTQVGVKFHF